MLGTFNEVVVAASSVDSTILVWDLYTGALVASYKNSSSDRNALCCIGGDYLAASQIHAGGGIIHFWAWQKNQIAVKSFPVETIGPIACTSNGAWLAGGGASGRLYLWEVASGRLMRSWPGHYKTVSSLVFSDDNSLLVSGGGDAVVSVWPLVRVLDCTEAALGPTGEPVVQPMYQWVEHTLPVTSLYAGVGGAHAVIVSSSMDHTCKIWSLALGSLLRSVVFPSSLNAVVLDVGEYSLFTGGTDGRIFITALNVGMPTNGGLLGESASMSTDAALVGHTRGVTSLAFAMDGISLVSASEDGTCRLWDTTTRQLLRSFTSAKGPVMSALVIPRPAALAQGSGGATDAQGRAVTQRRAALALPVAALQKYPGPPGGVVGVAEVAPWEGTAVILPSTMPPLEEDGDEEGRYYSRAVLRTAAAEIEGSQTAAAIRMEAEALRASMKRALIVASGWKDAHTELQEALIAEIEKNKGGGGGGQGSKAQDNNKGKGKKAEKEKNKGGGLKVGKEKQSGAGTSGGETDDGRGSGGASQRGNLRMKQSKQDTGKDMGKGKAAHGEKSSGKGGRGGKGKAS